MAYVAVKGGEQAILNSYKLIAETRRGDTEVAELALSQIREQLGLVVDRVMTEGSVYDRDLAALALKQAQGDTTEAIFLLRAYRTTLPRITVSEPIDTATMAVRRRVSALFKDIPGGQVLGPTYDYTHRLLDFALAAEGDTSAPQACIADAPLEETIPNVFDVLGREKLIEEERAGGQDEVVDLTREPMRFPAARSERLQNLACSDEGFVLGLAYSAVRGYGHNHPYCGEIRLGEVMVDIVPEELGLPIAVAEITVTECQMVNQFHGTATTLPQFTRGYGLTFGHCERKAMAMAIIDRALKTRELGEEVIYPAQNDEFVLAHSDSVAASGFIAHFKLPHYVDFQAELQLIRRLRREREEQQCAQSMEVGA